MNMNGTQIIDAPRQVVWKGLNDPQILKGCIPGCEKIEASSSTQMKATVVVKVGPVKATFAGEVTLSNLNAPESYRISGKGQGGFAGFADGGATVKLTALSATQTQMDYAVDAQIGGKLAMLGSRLIDSTAQSLAGQFFTKFGALIKAQGAQSPSTKLKKTAKKKAAVKSKVATKKKKPAKPKVGAKKAAVKFKTTASKVAAKPKIIVKKKAAKKRATKKFASNKIPVRKSTKKQ
jgi:uncharacterized protein